MKKQIVKLFVTALLGAVSASFALAQRGGVGTPPPRTTTPPTSSISQAVDLGLSVKWASCNIGATKPEENGDYYAWGEVITKSSYNWSTYRYCPEGNSFTKYNNDSKYGPVDNKEVLDLSDDIAHEKLGGDWRMPTREEWDELCNNSLWEWTAVNGKKGYKVTGPNGNSIFLPAAGVRYDTGHHDAGSHGFYWSSSFFTGYPYSAWYLVFYSDNAFMNYDERCNGLSVRPVSE